MSSSEEHNVARTHISELDEKVRQGVMIRNRSDNINHMDRPTKYHFAQNAARHTGSQITVLQDLNTKITHSTQPELERITMDFWSKIFSKRTTHKHQQDRLLNCITNIMPDEVSNDMGKEITIDDIRKAIKKTTLGKSPGKDGIPTYFYEKIAMNNDKMLLKFFKNVIDESHQHETLPRSMREIQIRLLYKKTTEEDKKNT